MIPGSFTYKGNDLKVRDCHLEESFYGYAYYKSLTFGEGIQKIYWSEETNLDVVSFVELVALPASLEFMDFAPVLCSLQSVTVPESNAHYKTVDGILYNKAMTDLILVPATKPMASYTVPASVTTIKVNAFAANTGTKEFGS